MCKVISGLVLMCDSVQSWQLYSAAQLENQARDSMTQFSTLLHYPDSELSNPCNDEYEAKML